MSARIGLSPEAIKALAEAGKRFREAFREAILRMNQVLAESERRRLARDPELAERRSELRYQRRIEQERQRGLQYVDTLTDEMARRYGLDPEIKNRKVK